MRTTLNLNDELYRRAAEATGIQEKTKLIHQGLEELIRAAAIERLIKLYGRAHKSRTPSRRRVTRWS